MSSTERFVEHAARYAEDFVAPPDAVPATATAVVACMDARIDVFSLFGIRLGDAHVIRNAGGSVTEDTIRSLSVSQRFLHTREIVLVHHTRCGMQNLDDDAFADQLERETGVRPPFRPGGFRDPAADVRLSARTIRESPFVPHRDEVRGFVLDVDTGDLVEVDLDG